MAVRVAVVGPGRIGTALAALWARGGCELLGFVGRTPDSAARAVAFCGSGRVLAPAELHEAACVLLAVPDDVLAVVAREHAAAGHVRRCSLWLHASGAHDLDALAPLAAAGARVGSLHPPCPVPDPSTGVATLPGKPAVLDGSPESLRLLAALAERAGMRPLPCPGRDRALYHAACALGANGATALCAVVEQVLTEGVGVAGADARAIVAALVLPAAAGVTERGAAATLSGPVRRGDSTVVAGHVAALSRSSSPALPSYRVLMHVALAVAERAGLVAADRAAAIRAVLDS